jgi:SAM-dependent methyltransferase
MSTYTFDQGWEKERERLGGIESLFDEYSTQRLAALGVSEGWQCLEIGFGAGSVALWLADKVGSTGRVVATDLDPRFLDGHSRSNLEVRKYDLATEPMEEAAFDLAHARLVLEWISDKQGALQRMVSAVRPGAWVVAQDGDFGGVMIPALARYVDPPEHAALYERIFRAGQAATGAVHDANYGARLVGAFKDAGLVNIAAEVHTPVVAGGTEKWLPGMVEFAAELFLGTGLVTSSDIESFLALTADPSVHYAPTLAVTAWGQRPA